LQQRDRETRNICCGIEGTDRELRFAAEKIRNKEMGTKEKRKSTRRWKI
jgi:hypothetical protein